MFVELTNVLTKQDKTISKITIEKKCISLLINQFIIAQCLQ